MELMSKKEGNYNNNHHVTRINKIRFVSKLKPKRLSASPNLEVILENRILRFGFNYKQTFTTLALSATLSDRVPKKSV